ncbi:MAG: hypothetical protein QF473_26310 [Planctomycetota bacterium]|jgi:hypothetical protein|nr:hypothetical protein [Planctomycetota bacterium]MDP6504568.1 hypothetical protein [Planctomycetota bacterium]
MAGNEELFGLIAVRSGLIRRPQLAKALAAQENRKHARKRLGEILVGMGALESDDVRNILHVQALMYALNPDMQLIMDAIQHDLVTEQQAGRCMEIQADENYERTIGDILVDQMTITEQQKDDLLNEIQSRHGDGSKLVRIIQEASQSQEGAPGMSGLDEARLGEAKQLIAEGVRSLVHLGIISHMVHRQGETYDLKHFVDTLDESRKEVQHAIDDLVELKILIREKKWTGHLFRFTDDSDIRLRVEILLLCCNEPRHRREMFSMLLSH